MSIHCPSVRRTFTVLIQGRSTTITVMMRRCHSLFIVNTKLFWLLLTLNEDDMFRQPWSTIYHSLVLLLLIATKSKGAAKEQTCVQGEDGTCSNDQESTAALIQPANGLVEIDWGETQLVNGELWQQSLQNIEATKLYMAAVRTNDKLKNVVTECKSRDKLCSFWAAKGKIYIL